MAGDLQADYDIELLWEVAGRRNPELTVLAVAQNLLELTTDHYDELLDYVSGALEWDENWEPTAYGRRVDDLITVLAPLAERRT